MHESFEFRVVEEFASRLFGPHEGQHLGIVRRVEISADDPRLPRIGDLQRALDQESGRAFFHGWQILRQYSKSELAAAPLLHLKITSVFEPAGEECGTRYDESTACPRCGTGALQVSNLRLDLRRVPKSKDIARTIADEWIVSQRLAERMIDAGLTGFELRPVRHKARYEDDPLDFHQVPTGREILRRAETAGAPHPSGKFWVWLNRAENGVLLDRAREENAALAEAKSRRSGTPLPVWHQLVVASAQAEIVPPTRVGIDPFDDDPDGRCRCIAGDLIGLNLLSEVSVLAATRGEADIVCSRQYIGTRRDLLRPSRVILVSQRFWSVLRSAKSKGADVEVAHLV